MCPLKPKWAWHCSVLECYQEFFLHVPLVTVRNVRLGGLLCSGWNGLTSMLRQSLVWNPCHISKKKTNWVISNRYENNFPRTFIHLQVTHLSVVQGSWTNFLHCLPGIIVSFRSRQVISWCYVLADIGLFFFGRPILCPSL